MKKKVIALMLAAAMVVSVTACGGGSDTTTPAADSGDAAAETTDGGEAPAEDAGADDSAAPAASGEGKILSVQIGPNPETIDPALNSAVDGGNMILHTFECLLTVDQDGKLAPGQAESWETSEDGLTLDLPFKGWSEMVRWLRSHGKRFRIQLA